MFQDFNALSERRRVERAQKKKKKIIIGVVVTLIILAAAGVAAFFVISNSNDHHKEEKSSHAKDTKKPESKGEDHSEETTKTNDVSRMEKGIKMMCEPTDYKTTCEESVGKAMKKKHTTSDKPLDLFKGAVSAIIDEIDTGFNETIKGGKIDDPKVKGAVEDCQVLLRDAKEELGETIAQINGNMDKFTASSPEMQNWLSAVMSYQQTCIDGFPDGKTKDSLKKGMQTAKEMTSNSLAIISDVGKALETMMKGLGKRNLLDAHSVDEDGFPSWMPHEDRRILKSDTANLKPNVVVAKDGSGKFKTIKEALDAMPQKYDGRYIIYIKEGVYEETVEVGKKMVNVTMFGDGSQKTIVTGSKNFVDGTRTFQTATFAALGDGFMAQAMGFRNTAGPEKHQAVALRVQSDRAVFLNCRMDGYQDTLYAQTHRQFYRACVITGTVDFIFGDASAIIQNTNIFVRKPMDNQQNIVTAQGRVDKRETTGIVLHKCKIMPDDNLVPAKDKIKSYLGRPWKEFSRTVIMESEIGDFINADGWLPWEGDFALKTLSYHEYANTGPGAKTDARVKWPGYKVINKEEAMKFTVGPFLQGETWLKGSGVPVQLGLFSE